MVRRVFILFKMSGFVQSVEKKFIEAKESKDLFSFETTVVKKVSNDVEVSLGLAIPKKKRLTFHC